MIDRRPSRIARVTMASAPSLTASGSAERHADAPAPRSAVAATLRRERLERMFQAHHQLIWRTLRRLGLAPDAATDTTQQVFLIAVERLADIRPESERAFLFGTALRLARSWRRKQARVQLDERMDQRPAPQNPEDQAVARHRAMQLMDHILAHLDADLVAVVVLFELEGMSTPEIADLTGVPLGTAASRLRRARAAFREAAARLEQTTRSRTP